MTQTPLTPIIDFLRHHAPFDRMAEGQLEFLAKRLRLVFYSAGETLLYPEQGAAETFHIVKQGRVRGESREGGERWELEQGECFPIGALLSRRPVDTVVRAVEDTFCFELERNGFEQLLQKSPVFHDFCTRRLASLLDSALRQAQANSASTMAARTTLDTPLRKLIKREPVTCHPDTPLAEALARMQRERVGSIIVTDSGNGVVGIFTLHDLLDRVALAERPLDTPVREVMTVSPLTLPASTPAHDAALLMTRHAIGHLCVVDGEKLLGMVAERDLFTMQQLGLASVARSIEHANSVEQLAALGHDIHSLVEQMLAQGVAVAQLTQLITSLNDALTRRVIALVLAQQTSPLPPFTWLAFGSEGRGEQTLKTDQDNGILFLAKDQSQAVRDQLLSVAREINEALDACGFPLCPGNVMASNPECCLSLEEWQERFARWLDQGTPEHLLKGTIFFDFRVLWGDERPLDELRQWLLAHTARNSRFRRQLAASAMRFRPPLGLFGEFRLSHKREHAHTLDLKLQGLTPFVDAARIIALAHGIEASNTVERLEQAAAAGKLNAADVAAWVESYHFIQLLRMRRHREQAQQGEALSNRLDPDRLNDLERRILKEAFRQARKLQGKLALEYQL